MNSAGDANTTSMNRSKVMFALMAVCVFLLNVATESRVNAMEPSSPYYQINAAESHSVPVEVAQLSPGRVQILEGESDEPQGSKLLFSDNKLKQAGFILSETTSVGTIIKNLGLHDSFATGEIVYLDIGTDKGVSKGDLLSIFTKKRPVLHPVIEGDKREGILSYERPVGQEHPPFFSKVGKRMGYLVHTLGYLEILEADQGSSKAVIREAYNPIRNGDMVTPYQKPNDPPFQPEAKGEQTITGYVMAFKRDHYLGGTNDILYIDRGRKDHVMAGDRFEVYVTPTREEKYWYVARPQGDPLIPHVIGEVQILDTQEESSTAVVIASSRAIPLGAPIRYKPVDIVSPPLNDLLALQDAPVYERVEEEIPLEAPIESIMEEEPFADLQPSLFEREEEEAEEAKLLSFHPSIELINVHFRFDKDDLDDIARQALQRNADYLKEHPNVKVQIEGHCDERGTNNYNLALGERRAHSVKVYLESLGIEDDRMLLISYGEEKPVCSDSNESCWQQNRKVHFLINESGFPVN